MGLADLGGVGGEWDMIILNGEVALFGVDGAVMTAEKFPTQDKVIYEVFDDATVGPHVSALDAKLDVNGTNSLNFAAVYADGLALVRSDVVFEEGGMTSEHALTDAGPLATCVYESGTCFPIYVNQDLGFEFGFEVDRGLRSRCFGLRLVFTSGWLGSLR